MAKVKGKKQTNNHKKDAIPNQISHNTESEDIIKQSEKETLTEAENNITDPVKKNK